MELEILRGITSTFPAVRGFGQLSDRIASFYARKQRDEAEVKALGLRWKLRPAECQDRKILFGAKHYDRIELAELRKLVRPTDVFLDAGANVGFYSLNLAPYVRTLIAVEATSDTFRRLRYHLEVNGMNNATAVHCGLSDKEEIGHIGIVTGGNTSGNSFLVHKDGLTEAVPCKPLLQVLREQGVDRLDVMKIDIEGYEFKVLEPFFREAPQEFHPRALMVEWSDKYIKYSAGHTLEMLTSNGYIVRYLHDDNYIAERA